MPSLRITRRPGETVMIGDNISVRIAGVRGNQVSVVITAPADVSIDREEIRYRKNQGLPPPKVTA
jgi:carbon storage regulator